MRGWACLRTTKFAYRHFLHVLNPHFAKMIRCWIYTAVNWRIHLSYSCHHRKEHQNDSHTCASDKHIATIDILWKGWWQCVALIHYSLRIERYLTKVFLRRRVCLSSAVQSWPHPNQQITLVGYFDSNKALVDESWLEVNTLQSLMTLSVIDMSIYHQSRT